MRSDVRKRSLQPDSGLPEPGDMSHSCCIIYVYINLKKRRCSKQISLTSSDVQNNCRENYLNMKNSQCWSEACIITLTHCYVHFYKLEMALISVVCVCVSVLCTNLFQVCQETRKKQSWAKMDLKLLLFFLIVPNFHLRTKKSQLGEKWDI